MEEKTNNQVSETECLLYEKRTGMFYRMTLEEEAKVNELQKQLNDELSEKGLMSFEDMWNILTQDWTPEQKLQYLIDRDHGWSKTVSSEKFDFKKIRDETEDGIIIIHFDCLPKEESPE